METELIFQCRCCIRSSGGGGGGSGGGSVMMFRKKSRHTKNSTSVNQGWAITFFLGFSGFFFFFALQPKNKLLGHETFNRKVFVHLIKSTGWRLLVQNVVTLLRS